MAKTFLTAEWRKLIMANYVVPESLLLPYLPLGTELDRFQGQSFVSLIGFLFCETRLKGFRIPFHGEFEEVNLRFYVRRTDASGAVRRGVVFLRELVPRVALCVVANSLYGEKYAVVRMKHVWRSTGDSLSVGYSWRKKGRWFEMQVDSRPQAEAIAEGSVEEFITEHYWGYTKLRDGRTSEYEVVHPRWVVYPVERYGLAVDFAVNYGSHFAGLDGQKPQSVLLAEGSAVSVLSGQRLG